MKPEQEQLAAAKEARERTVVGVAEPCNQATAEDPRQTLLFRINRKEGELLRQLTALREARECLGEFVSYDTIRALRLLEQGGLVRT